MDWFVLGPAAATRDLWVSVQGPAAPEYGVWTAPSGKPVHEILSTEGPPGVGDVEWYFEPPRGHYGKRLVDALWQGGDGLKVWSERMCAVLESCGARLQTWPADVRLRDGSRVEGYLAVLEEVDSPGPVHSSFRGRRVGRVTISGEVRTALRDAGMTGLELNEASSAFPRDHGVYGDGSVSRLAPMRAVQVVTPTGPSDVVVRDVPEPTPGPNDVLVEVHTVGVSFPDLLLSRGEYQLKPEPPFTLGVDFAGVVLDPGSPESSGFTAGQRVCGVNAYGGAAEQVANPVVFTFALPDATSYDEGAALPMNYLTAQFALAERGDLRPGETVLVHGAAGGVGTATLQVAKGYGARTIAVVSTEQKADLARAAGADEVVVGPDFKDAVKELTNGRGVDVVMDPVGGDAFTDSLRCLAEQGRVLVVGFASGQGIPQVKVNRLLLGNVDVRGVGWGAYAMMRPGYMQQQWHELLPMIESGVVKPPIGATYELEDFGRALQHMDDRLTLGKSVVRVR